MVVTAKEPVKRGKHCRLMGLSWPIYTAYIERALKAGLVEKRMTRRGDPGFRKKPEIVYVATERGLAWAKIFWDASKVLYGVEVGSGYEKPVVKRFMKIVEEMP